MIGWYARGAYSVTERFVLTMPRASFVFAVQTWLAQTPEQARNVGTQGYLAAGMARKSSILCTGNTRCLRHHLF